MHYVFLAKSTNKKNCKEKSFLRKNKSLYINVYVSAFNSSVLLSRRPCATLTALKTEGGRQPPEDCVRYALSAYHGGYFNATHTGLVAKQKHFTGHPT